MKKNKKESYCEKYDVFYDTESGDYKENKCSDPDCEYCAQRPEHLNTDHCQHCDYEDCTHHRQNKNHGDEK